MSAEVVQLPVIVRFHGGDDLVAIRPEPEVLRKLDTAAVCAGSTRARMAEALIVWGLAAIEHKTPDEFYSSLGIDG